MQISVLVGTEATLSPRGEDRNAGCIGEIEGVITTSDFLPRGNENLSKGGVCAPTTGV